MYYKQLDGVRCFCVIAVLLQHFINPLLSKYYLTGQVGVDLFFIISGFLITESLLKLKEQYSFKKAFNVFYARRILRIFPLYYFYWLIIAVFFFSAYKPTFAWGLLYGINFYYIYFTDRFPLIIHLWSLAVEEQFYIVWPFLILLSRYENLKKYTLWLLLAGLLYTIWNLGEHNGYYYNYMHPFSCAIALLSGALLAILKKEDNTAFHSFGKYKYLITSVFFLGTIMIGYLCGKGTLPEEYKIISRILTCLFGYMLIPIVTNNGFKGLWGRILSYKPIQYIGRISYGVYIYHQLVKHLMTPYVEHVFDNIVSAHFFDSGIQRYIRYNPTLFQFPVYVLGTILVASASYHLLEKRFLNLKYKFQ